MRRYYMLGLTLVLALLLLSVAAVALSPAKTVEAQNTACYRPVGGASFECADGGSFVVGDGAQLVVESGGTLDVASGATFAVDADLSVDGAMTVNSTLDIAGTGGNIASSSGAITMTDGVHQALNYENIGMLPTVASAVITYGMSGASLNIFTIADGEIWVVHDMLVKVTSNFNCTGDNCTLTIGDGNDADGFIVLADGALQATDTEGTGFAAGWQGMNADTRGIYLDGDANDNAFHPFVYAPSGAAETIDFAVGGTDPAAGVATVYIWYTRLQ